VRRATVGPKAGDSWQVSGDRRDFDTQREAVAAARRQLQGSGGGEIVVKGRDGRVRMQNTIGRPNPRKSKG
jgi:hypothetical protein